MTQLSPHFALEEATISQTAERQGIDNTPSQDTIAVMTQTAIHMENVRSIIGFPLHIDSWYRSPEVNRAVGGVNNSQHCVGEAVDFICPQYGTPFDLCKKIIASNMVDYDQLILEHTWVHISFAISSGNPRKQVLSLLESGGYASGLTDIHGTPLN